MRGTNIGPQKQAHGPKEKVPERQLLHVNLELYFGEKFLIRRATGPVVTVVVQRTDAGRNARRGGDANCQIDMHGHETVSSMIHATSITEFVPLVYAKRKLCRQHRRHQQAINCRHAGTTACREEAPAADSFDVWQAWLSICFTNMLAAPRAHAKTAQAWPK